MPRAALTGLAVVVLLVGVMTGLVWRFQRQLIYFPDGDPGPPAAWGLTGADEVALETSDGLRLAAWWLPAAEPDAPAVLVANGNGGHRGLRAPLARALRAAGLAVLLFDYRGYGGNPGNPSEEGLARDIRAAWSYLVDSAGVPPGRLVYFGESLGAGVVSDLAVEHPPAGLVLRSPFTDLAAVGRVHYPFLPVRLLLRDRYPVVENVAKVEAPVSVVYGGADSIVPPAQSRAVAEAAKRLRAVVEVPGADHNDAVLLDGGAVVHVVVELARAAA